MGRGITEPGFVNGEKAFHRSTWVQEEHSSVPYATLCHWLFLSSLDLLLLARRKK